MRAHFVLALCFVSLLASAVAAQSAADSVGDSDLESPARHSQQHDSTPRKSSHTLEQRSPAMSYPAMSYPAMSYPAMSYPALSDPTISNGDGSTVVVFERHLKYVVLRWVDSSQRNNTPVAGVSAERSTNRGSTKMAAGDAAAQHHAPESAAHQLAIQSLLNAIPGAPFTIATFDRWQQSPLGIPQGHRGLWLLEFKGEAGDASTSSDSLTQALEDLRQIGGFNGSGTVDGGIDFAEHLLLRGEEWFVPNREILIMLDDYESTHVLPTLLAENELELLEQIDLLAPIYRCRVPSGTAFEKAHAVRGQPHVSAAQPNFIFRLRAHATPNDPEFNLQWHLSNSGQYGGTPGADIRAELAWELATGSDTLILAIVDQGIDSQHPDLIENLIPGVDFTDEIVAISYPGQPASGAAHGTCCAGIAAGRGNNALGVSGVAWQSTLVSVKIVDRFFLGQLDWTINGIGWAVNNGADVISCSWGTLTPSDFLENAFQFAGALGRGGLGCVVTCSAGNGSTIANGTEVEIPASYDSTIAVGATSPCDERRTASSCAAIEPWFSKFGMNLDLVAPGDLITTTGNIVPGLDNYVTFGGTSAACPQVAGAAALLMSVSPQLDGSSVADLLCLGADDGVGVAAEDTPEFDSFMGHGRLNVFQSLNLLNSVLPPTNFSCSVVIENIAKLDWDSVENYNNIIVEHNGVVIDVLPGGLQVYYTPIPSNGIHRYSIQGVIGAQQSPRVSCSLFYSDNATDLVWSPFQTGGPIVGGAALVTALEGNGKTTIEVQNLVEVPDLDLFDRIWVNLGTFPNNHVLTGIESQRLLQFVTNGVGGSHVYVEGSDTWFLDPQTPFHELFSLEALSDGASDLAEVQGLVTNACDLSSFDLAFSGENVSIDQLQATSESVALMHNPVAGYDTWVLRDLGHQRLLGSNYEFGGVTDEAQRALLLAELIDCLGTNNAPLSVRDLQCDSLNNGNVLLSWTNRGNYDALQIERNGQPLVTLSGTQSSYLDTGVPTGSFGYRIVPLLDNVAAPPRQCSTNMVTPNNAIVGSSAAAGPGQTAEHQVLLSAEQNTSYGAIEAYSYGVTFDPIYLQVLSVSSANSVGEEADFFTSSIDNVSGYYTVQAEFVGLNTFPIGYNLALATALFQVDDNAILGTTIPLEIPEFVGGVTTEVVQSGLNYSPVRYAGSFQVIVPSDFGLAVGSAVGAPGQGGIPLKIYGTYQLPLTGFSFGLDYNEDSVAVDEVNLDGTVTGSVQPGFFAPQIFAESGYFTVGVIMDLQLMPAITLPVGSDLPLINAVMRVKTTAQAGTTPLVIPSAIGDPPVQAIFVVGTTDYMPEDVTSGGFTVIDTTLFLRGDITQDGTVGLGDAIAILSYLFSAGSITCYDAADLNDDGLLGLPDPLQLLAYLFSGGPPPAAPWPDPGFDSTPDFLSCN